MHVLFYGVVSTSTEVIIERKVKGLTRTFIFGDIVSHRHATIMLHTGPFMRSFYISKH